MINQGAKEKGWIAPLLLNYLPPFWAERGLGFFLFNQEFDQISKIFWMGRNKQILIHIVDVLKSVLYTDLRLWHWRAVGKINVTSLLPGQAAGSFPARCLPSSPRTLAGALLLRQSLYQQRSASFLVLSMENAQRVKQGDFYWIH